MIDYTIEKLTKLLIRQDIEDKKNGTAYIKKVDVYRDLIRFFKELKNNGIFNN